MKNTLRSFCLALVIGFSAPSVFGQETIATAIENYDQGFRLGFGLNGGLPLNDPYDFSLGGDVRLQYDLTKKTSLTLTTGFTNFFVSGKDNDLGFIPLKAGFKVFVYENEFYLIGEAGAAFAVTNNYDKTSLLLSPGVGYATKVIDFSLRYEYLKDFIDESGDEGIGQVVARVAYAFEL
ncbi:hypothetical protein [Flavobacterium sp.]|uniref:hypothetical protein n=1 Tax=Flavobacterium sp. TaxID=239 RepID=UPI003B9BE071